MTIKNMMLRKPKASSPGEESQLSNSSGNSFSLSSVEDCIRTTSFISSTETGTPPTRSTSNSFELCLEDEFTILKTLSEGCYAKILLAKREKNEKMVLKAIHAEITTENEFLRELNTNYFLSPHPNIITSYNVSFLWNNHFVFVQEYAPFGDLSKFVKKGGLAESQVKLVARQLVQALDFMHNSNLVHRDIKLENVLVFRSNLTIIKLCDFGCTRNEGSLVRKTSQTWIPFSPPELCLVVIQERYYVSKASDAWQLGILLYVCLTGTVPWQQADISDPSFSHYNEWLRKKSFKLPEAFKGFSERMLRLFKRLLEPKPSYRYEVIEVNKYLRDDWFKRNPLNGSNSSLKSGSFPERKESVKTSHSSNTKCKSVNYTTNNFSSWRQRSMRTLKKYGLETELDKTIVSERVQNWIRCNKKYNVPHEV